MSGEKYAIKNILKMRKLEGTDKMEYLVDWEPTWVDEEDVDAHLLDDYRFSLEVLGPIDSEENLKKSSIKDMDLVVLRRNRHDLSDDDDEVILELMPYEQVKKLYPDELFKYIESTFSLPEEMCESFQKNTNDGKKSSKKKQARKRKLSK